MSHNSFASGDHNDLKKRKEGVKENLWYRCTDSNQISLHSRLVFRVRDSKKGRIYVTKKTRSPSVHTSNLLAFGSERSKERERISKVPSTFSSLIEDVVKKKIKHVGGVSVYRRTSQIKFARDSRERRERGAKVVVDGVYQFAFGFAPTLGSSALPLVSVQHTNCIDSMLRKENFSVYSDGS